GFEPLVPGFKHVPYNDLRAMERAIDSRTAALIVEPIQGEGGVIVPDDDYLPGLRKLCDASGALLIVDAAQTGVRRTSTPWARGADGTAPHGRSEAVGAGAGRDPRGPWAGPAHRRRARPSRQPHPRRLSERRAPRPVGGRERAASGPTPDHRGGPLRPGARDRRHGAPAQGMMRHFLSSADLTRDAALQVFQLAADLKQRWKAGRRGTPLAGRTMALIFEKPSLRTRVTFEVGIVQLGGRAV